MTNWIRCSYYYYYNLNYYDQVGESVVICERENQPKLSDTV